jgi:hypothetical protein
VENAAWIIDAARSPRGKGKKSGALHERHPQRILAQVLKALKARDDFDRADVDDVVMGCFAGSGDHPLGVAHLALREYAKDHGMKPHGRGSLGGGLVDLDESSCLVDSGTSQSGAVAGSTQALRAPRINRPGKAPVCSPSRKVTSPETMFAE